MKFSLPLEKEGDLIQIKIQADTFISSKKPITLTDTKLSETELPSLFPMQNTISLPQTNIYTLSDKYRECNFLL